MPRRSPSVFLIGEAALVGEYGEACCKAGYSVSCKVNPGNVGTSLPKGLEKTGAIPGSVSLAIELTNTDHTAKRRNVRALDRALPSSILILSSSVTVSVAEMGSWLSHPERLLGIGAFPTLLSNRLVELAPAVQTERRFVSSGQEFFLQLGKEVSVVQDRIGMVLPRVLCTVINEAFFALTETVASPADIDTAMKLGTNYPLGPIEWAERIGLAHVVSVLEALYRDMGEERYRLAPLLRQMAVNTSWQRT